MQLTDLRTSLVDNLNILTGEAWDDHVKSYRTTNAPDDCARFLNSISKLKRAIGDQRLPLLSGYQMAAILDERDAGRSLLLNGGKILLVDIIGRGGQGSVYLAIFRNPQATDTIVAVKSATLPPRDSTAYKRLQKEMALLCESPQDHHVHSKHVVQGIDYFYDGNQIHFVMAYVSGVTLHSLVKKHTNNGKRLSVRDAMRLSDSILNGIECLHDRGLIHRDIKPKNVIHNDRNGPFFTCIVDLGLVKEKTSPVTAHGVIIGTPYYRAPECCGNADAADERSDLYGLAATLYFLICGEAPSFPLLLEIDAEKLSAKALIDTRQLSQASSSWSRTHLNKIREEVPVSLSDLVFETLSPNPDHRPQNVAAFRQRFDQCLNSIERVRTVQKQFKAFRKGIKQAVVGVVEESERGLFPDDQNALTFVSEVRVQFVRGKKGFRLPEDLPGAKDFNGQFNNVLNDLDSVLRDIEVKSAQYKLNTTSPSQEFANDLQSFQEKLPQLLAVQHGFSRMFAGLV